MAYTRRHIDILLDEIGQELPAIFIKGARGVGKTETSLQRAKTVFHLDAPDTLTLLHASHELPTTATPPVLLDEWQFLPDIWNVVRRAVDAGAPGGNFLLTGSADIPLEAHIHSGAGRITPIQMRPLTISERGVEEATVSLAELLHGKKPKIDGVTSIGLPEYGDEIARSGFPGIRPLSERARNAQLDAYIDQSTHRRLEGSQQRTPVALHAWFAAYAAATATTAGWEAILNAATSGQANKPARNTVAQFREHLSRLYLLDPLPAWTASFTPLKRLAASAKHHVVDPALALRLAGTDMSALLKGRGPDIPYKGTETFLGALFESLTVQSVRTYAELAQANTSHLRTDKGIHEIDIIVERRDGAVIPIEVKMTQTPSDGDVKHLNWLEQQIPDRIADKILITTSQYAYRRQDGVAVIPLALLGP